MGTRVVTAVCTGRRAADVAACLEALAAQMPLGDLLLVTSGLERFEVERHRRGFADALESEPLPGLSRARNRALAWAARAEADVLAFVDDDALVEEAWLEQLRRAWDEAPPEVACIGGPIRPRYAVEPPPWLSDGIVHTLTLVDRGSSVRDLNPDVEAVYGANISFRVEALRRIGGFDPALGHRGRRAFFGEEDEAQRALVRLGYHVRYVPDAAVLHVIPAERLTRSSFLERRFAYGAALGMRRGRRRALALRQALSSSAGALVAGARGRDALAMERAVRAAENFGVLLSPLVARR